MKWLLGWWRARYQVWCLPPVAMGDPYPVTMPGRSRRSEAHICSLLAIQNAGSGRTNRYEVRKVR